LADTNLRSFENRGGSIRLSSQKMKEHIIEAINGKASDKALKCKVAQELAEELGVSTRRIGEIANEVNIKIKNCQLGCF